MTQRSFLSLIALIIAPLLIAGWAEAQNSSQIYRHSLFSINYERGQIRIILAEGAAPLVKEMRLEIYSFNGGKVFDGGASGKQPIVWGLQDQSGLGALDGKYICSIHLKLDGGESDVVFGRLSKSAQKVSFADALRLYEESPANGAREFFKQITELRPDNASAWMWYGQTVYKPLEIIFEPPRAPSSPTPLPPPPPPPPPPPAPPPPASEKENAGGQQRKTTSRFADPHSDESDLKEAINAFQIAIDLAVDCKTKDRALDFLAITYSRLRAEVEETEAILKRAESECATTEIKMASYYSLGVKHWQCAYSLSTAYIDGNKHSYDPFHYRNFANPADKQKFDDCLTKGFEFIEKALALDSEYVNAIFYQGLLYREKQKATADETERRQWAEEAQKLTAKGTDLQRRKEGRQ
jgi:tetratricopeptide (TPR) repeat protein